jgi:hypothetical protein
MARCDGSAAKDLARAVYDPPVPFVSAILIGQVWPLSCSPLLRITSGRLSQLKSAASDSEMRPGCV